MKTQPGGKIRRGGRTRRASPPSLIQKRLFFCGTDEVLIALTLALSLRRTTSSRRCFLGRSAPKFGEWSYAIRKQNKNCQHLFDIVCQTFPLLMTVYQVKRQRPGRENFSLRDCKHRFIQVYFRRRCVFKLDTQTHTVTG